MSDSIAARVRRKRLWLAAVVVVHLAVLVAIVVLAAGASVAIAGLAGLLAVGSPVLASWLEWRSPVGRRPACWWRRAFGVLLPQATAFGLVAGAFGIGWILQFLTAGALLVVQVGCVQMAAAALRFPVGPELGAMDVEVRMPLRSSQVGIPAWALPDHVRLTDSEIIASVYPSPGCAFARTIALTSVVDVSARPARSQDSPWLRLGDGREYVVPGGDVVEVRHDLGRDVLPVRDAAAFTEVIRSRLAVRGTAMSVDQE